MPKGSTPEDFIVPLNMNGLDGRVLHAPSSTKRQREILLVYGHHAMIERWWGLVQNLQTYGNVTMPDIPGFGGMESLYRIGLKPDVDAFADYLAAFVKMRYRSKRVSIFAISYGFVVVTRMLQKYPELARKVDLLVNVVGFVHKDDFVYSRFSRFFFRILSRFFGARIPAFIIRYGFLNRFIIKTLYTKLPNSRRRMIEVTPEEFNITMDFEVKLWQSNDVRTHWVTTSEFFRLDNTKKRINLPVFHVVSEQDHYFNNIVVEQHLRMIFKDYVQFTAKSKAHTPSILADKKAMSILVPPGLRKLLREDPS